MKTNIKTAYCARIGWRALTRSYELIRVFEGSLSMVLLKITVKYCITSEQKMS